MIHYTKAFIDNVGAGTLCARFRLDSNGIPVSGVEDGTTFYFIVLTLESPHAEKVQKVTYFLDAATYWEPERVSKNRRNQFAEEITSYGDFLVRVEVAMEGARFAQKALLSDMLTEGHKLDGSNPAIQNAIVYIRSN